MVSDSKLFIDVFAETERWEEKIPDVYKLCQQICVETIKSSGFEKYPENIEVSVTLAYDNFIRELNKRFTGKDKPTNVLSFPSDVVERDNFGEFTGKEVMLGDIIISLETLEKEALEQNKDPIHHLKHLLIHGCLHLLGYDHKTEEEAKIMESLEINLLKRYNVPNPYLIIENE